MRRSRHLQEVKSILRKTLASLDDGCYRYNDN